MPRFAANLTMMFTELPFLDRFAAAADAGFEGVEFLFPYEHPAEAVAEQLRRSRLENVMFNMPAGDWIAGDRGLACIPGREAEFRASVDKALLYATRMGTKRLHAMAGVAPAGVERGSCRETLISNLRYAAAKLAVHQITLLLEAINNRDMPGFFVSTQAESFAICSAVGAPNIAMQMDCYHIQVAEGDITTKLRLYAQHCGHIQIAGVPERHEPNTGEIRYEYLFHLLDEIGYTGWVGCEYRPAGRTVDGLKWFHAKAATV